MRLKKFNESFIFLLFLTFFTGFVIISLYTKTLSQILISALYLCKTLISNNITHFPGFFSIIVNAILVIFSATIILGILSFFLQFYSTNRLVKNLFKSRVGLSTRLKKVITQLKIEKKVYLVKDDRFFSFCSGIFTPHIIISTGLAYSLDDYELEAVLLHELSHLQSRDPLKLILGKTLSSMFFFLPIFSEINKNMSVTNEILADRFVIDSQKETKFLRGALSKIIANPQIELATIPSISNPDYLEIRINRIVNPSLKGNFKVSLFSIVTILLFFVISGLLMQVPVNAASSIEGNSPKCHSVKDSLIKGSEDLVPKNLKYYPYSYR